jgi:hypothetical protein
VKSKARNYYSNCVPPVEANNLTTVLEYLSSYRIHLRPFGKIDSGDVSWIPAAVYPALDAGQE